MAQNVVDINVAYQDLVLKADLSGEELRAKLKEKAVETHDLERLFDLDAEPDKPKGE